MLQLNETPRYDRNDRPTGCCPRFDPTGWDEQELVFQDKLFVRASTVSLFHVPLNMGRVFSRTWSAIEASGQTDPEGFLVLSHDESPWHAEHLFAVDHEVPGAETIRLTGTFLTKVFEGPFSQARRWCDEMAAYVEKKGKRLETLYFFYTTCPRCAKAYGKNWVVALARVT